MYIALEAMLRMLTGSIHLYNSDLILEDSMVTGLACGLWPF